VDGGRRVTDSTSTPDAPEGGRPTPLELTSTADLAKSVRALRNWLIVLSVLMALVFVVAAVAVVMASVGVASSWMLPSGTSLDDLATGADAVQDGPPLNSVASLPVDASGAGTIQGVPTGEAAAYDDGGTFELVLYPAPAGLPARTTLHVGFDHSTKVFRNGQALGDPLTAMNSESGPADADPSAAGTVIVRFHIKDGRAFADRLDLSDESPPGIEP
jgi:hypothetical protein